MSCCQLYLYIRSDLLVSTLRPHLQRTMVYQPAHCYFDEREVVCCDDGLDNANGVEVAIADVALAVDFAYIGGFTWVLGLAGFVFAGEEAAC